MSLRSCSKKLLANAHFAAFPIVFSDYHHFSLGASSLPFLGFLVTAVFAEAGYIIYQKKHILPRIFAGTFTPEGRLEVGLFAGCLIPISLFIFGWTSSRHIHWIGPSKSSLRSILRMTVAYAQLLLVVIGASLYLPGLFLLFQSIILYVFQAYPRYGAAVLAANDLFRAGFGASRFRSITLLLRELTIRARLWACSWFLAVVRSTILRSARSRPWIFVFGRTRTDHDCHSIRELAVSSAPLLRHEVC